MGRANNPGCCSGNYMGACCGHFLLGGFLVAAGALVGLYIPMGFQVCVSCPMRGAIREHWGIPGGSFEDCCCTFFCDPCTLAQEFKELIDRVMLQNTGQVMVQPGAPAAM